MLKKLKRIVIKEELVELTGDFKPAIILNQFIYWLDKMHDFDRYVREEKNRAERHQVEVKIDETSGWIYKTAEELNEELMINMSNATIRKYIKQLVENGWLQERRNPKYKWDKTLQYRVNLLKIQRDLHKLGYSLEGYNTLFTLDEVAITSTNEEPVTERVEHIENHDTNEVVYISEKVTMVKRFKRVIKSDEELSNENINTINSMDRDILVEALDKCLIHKIRTFEGLYNEYLNLLENEKESSFTTNEDSDIKKIHFNLIDTKSLTEKENNFKSKKKSIIDNNREIDLLKRKTE
ncbi:hypothetical protein [Romboutsia sp.]|uniref:hypothetical protein n=1 Tax=Romboutsia sp. TaxID=1965302 RepID=UPI002C62C70B|nr:hypothetical protein [Romboutsia sp.]HSQ88701.1 hypothetical protein [Romboutsia sp.]